MMSHKALGNCCIATGARSPMPVRVKSGNAHNEPMMSAFHPIATEQRTRFYVGSVPIGDSLAVTSFEMLSRPDPRDVAFLR
jgi:hypothetical protein